ncbi:MAG: MBL fold metallo-hydrolase [Myxococcota bacterium]
MKITFLGSGGAFTDYRVNYHNNALVETDIGPVLLDCGFTACQSLRELQIHPTALKGVLFTHLHADHASPEQLVWERFYSSPDGAPAYLTTPMAAPGDLLRPLKSALHAYMDIYTNAAGEIRHGGVDEMIDFQHTHETEIGGVRFSFFRVPHVKSGPVDKAAFGVRIARGDKVVYWSGDTTLAPDWIQRAADDPDVVAIFHECTFTPRFPGTVHTHWEELRTLPEHILRRMILMHHTQVPDGVDVSMLAGAAKRHQIFNF